MATETVLLGIDVSTTAVKALLVDARVRVVGQGSAPLTLSSPRPLWSEQQPTDWWTACVASIRQALATSGVAGSAIAAIGLTGQMHGLVALDADGEVLRPAILWNDQRTAAQCDEIRARVGRERLIQITGNDALTGFTAPKILWVAEQEPEVYARIRHILLPKDYLRLMLTDDYAMDKADGSGTILFDLRARDWSPDVLAALGIPAEWLPPTFEGPAATGGVSAAAAAATGLVAGTPVVAGGGDQAAGATGVGATHVGIAALTLGTSGVVFATTDAPLIEPQGRLHAFCHAVPGRWHLMGVTLSAAGSLQWYRDTLAPGVSFDDLMTEAAQAPAGSEGLLFLPYLTGERTPYPDPQARGAWVGLTTRHTRAHLTRAVLEGVAFSMRDTFELMRGAGLATFTETRVSGGGARSLLWRRIMASALGVELASAPTTEGAAYGAALLAGVNAGVWPDVDTAANNETSQAASQSGAFPRVAPDPADAVIYDQRYPLYRALYPALKPTFDALAYPPAPSPTWGKGSADGHRLGL